LVKTLSSNIDPELDTLELLVEQQTIREYVNVMNQYLFQGEFVYIQLVRDDQQIWLETDLEIDAAYFLIEPVESPMAVKSLDLPQGSVVDFKRQLQFRCGPRLEQPTLPVEWCNGASYVRIGLDPFQVSQELQQAVLLLGLVSAGFILVGLVVAFILYKWVLGPVDVLTDSVKQFRRDRFARAHVHSGDELEALADEFNKMASTIARHEHHLERINTELYKANQVKSEFLAVMGHELKTPLHAIRGFSQLLLQGVDGSLSGEQAKDIEAILSSGNHLLELIDNILRFSKLEAGEEPLHVEPLYADEVVAEAVQSVDSLVRNRRLDLRDETPHVAVQADQTKLKQILINLISNAIKYTPQGTITVGAAPQNGGARGGAVRFWVADTGPGIAADDAHRVFEPFTQLDGSNTRESSGIGLGLAIVKKYIEMHRGRVWHEPNPGGGTVFYFSLPAVQSEATAGAEAANGRANGAETRPRGDALPAHKGAS
jgi:signal transduction histidine kinase